MVYVIGFTKLALLSFSCLLLVLANNSIAKYKSPIDIVEAFTSILIAFLLLAGVYKWHFL